MKPRFCSGPAIATLAVALVLGALAIGPYMRETDEGWLLDGGMNIANGHPEITRAEFNFDKQFVSYYLAGLLFKCLPHPYDGDTLVLAGNILGMMLFWGSLFWLMAHSSRRMSLCCALPVILTPCFLVYSPFYASAFTSVSLILILAYFFDRKAGGSLTWAASFLLAFGAVGARLDAIFLLPLLAMLHSRRPTFVSVLKNPATWLMAAGGLSAFFLGRELYSVDSVDYVPLTIKLKQSAVFVLFGLGAAALLLLVTLIAVTFAGRIVRSKAWLVFLGAALILPMGYYSLQLLSPRHCVVGAISVTVFLCAKRGRILLGNFLQSPAFGALVKIALAMAAVLPAFVGINLADIHHPSLTVNHPTLLPSGAGVAPTGAYLAFAGQIRHNHGYLDHNHAIWMAAKNTDFQAAPDGDVHYLFSPVESYLRFAIRLQGKTPSSFSIGITNRPQRFYLETRSLMRYQFVYAGSNVALDRLVAGSTFRPATKSDWHGITILQADSSGEFETNSPYSLLWVFNTVFGPDEFRRESISILDAVPKDLAGKKLVIASQKDIHIDTSISVKNSMLHDPILGDWHVVEWIIPKTGGKLDLSGVDPHDIFVAVGAFPEWMSLRKM